MKKSQYIKKIKKIPKDDTKNISYDPGQKSSMIFSYDD